ncbi:response regulator [Deinococcus taeanensis]|uniref:response regulator n=1 Tax=Deinococcus taeanensis TaxID=2737050 RepID=UPI001CDCCBE2|nr:response regulator [Deinococcus taeanensis]UBV41670.1 response regulator [Deinococcus taeanensis]
MPGSTPQRLCVLLVDDNPADRLLAEEAFGAMPDAVSVHMCQSGHDALAWLRAHKDALPDVMILDVNMPGMTGLEVLQIVRDDPGFRHLPVVMLSTSDQPEDINRAYELVASSYWVKQADFAGFLKQIEDFVRFWQHARFRNRAPAPRRQ